MNSAPSKSELMCTMMAATLDDIACEMDQTNEARIASSETTSVTELNSALLPPLSLGIKAL